MIGSPLFKIRAHRAIWYDSIEFILQEEREDHKKYLVTDMTIEEVEPGRMVDPSFQIDFSEGQVLIDQLWEAGLRPSEGSGSAGSLKATENHLNDMRNIVFKKLGINNEHK